MMNVGFLARLRAKQGKEQQLQALLKGAVALAKAEQRTLVWYAFQTQDGQCWIFDAFEDEAGRKAHLEGEIAKALMANAPELLAEAPEINPVSLLAVK